MAPQKRRKALRRLLAAHDKSYPLMVLYPENCSAIDPQQGLKLIPDEKFTITRDGYNIGTNKTKGTMFYGPASLSEPHAQLYRNKFSDSVWIKDLNSEQGTFLNGKEISREFKRKVNPGDIITFGPSDNYKKAFSLKLIKMESKVSKVKSKKKYSEPKADVLIDSPQSPQNMVFNIPLLINKIFSFVSSPQKYRTINKATSVEISRQLGRSLKLIVEESAFDEQLFAKRLELFGKYKITTADFVLADEAKYGYRDLLWFGDNHGDKIQNANVFIRAHNVGTIQASLRLLNCLVNCQQLFLSVHVDNFCYNSFKQGLSFASVKKLVCPEFRNCYFAAIDPTVAVEIFKGFPNLEELEIPFRLNMNNVLLKSLHFLIPAPGQSILLPKLVSLSIRNPVSSQTLEILAKIPHKLQKLVLDECADAEALNKVLAKHAVSLTTLKFGINGWAIKGVVVIPAMAKLTHLAIQCSENLGCEVEIKVGTLPELLFLKANVTSYLRSNPFELLRHFFPGYSDAEVKAKKLKLIMVWTESQIKDNVNWLREKFCTNFPKGEFIQKEMPISFD